MANFTAFLTSNNCLLQRETMRKVLAWTNTNASGATGITVKTTFSTV
jgi:hypothetical protein